MRRNELELDALREVVNVGVGRAAATLSEMVETRVVLHAPNVVVLEQTNHELLQSIGKQDSLATVQQDFAGVVEGSAMILFPATSANRLVCLLLGEEVDEEEWDSERAATLTEVGNIMINSVMGSIANMTDVDFSFHLPRFKETSLAEIEDGCVTEHSRLILIEVEFNIEEGRILGNLMILFKAQGANQLFATMGRMIDAIP